MFHFCDWKLQQRFNLKEEISKSKKEIESLLNSLGEFLKASDQANKVSQIPLPKPEFETGFTKAKDHLLSNCYKDITEHLNRQIRLSFRFKKTRLPSFPWKSLNITVINSFLQKLSTWVTVKSNISTRINFNLLRSVTFLRAILMYSAFTLIVCLPIALFFSLVTCIVQSVRGKFAWTKRLFNFSAEAIINIRLTRLCARCANFLLKVKRIPFSCRLAKGFTFLERLQNHINMLFEMCIVLASIVSTERNAIPLTVM